jgi:predicted DNA binding CopG/RHH family protein
MKNKIKVPEFESEAEERAYWEKEDSVGHVDWSKAGRATLPNLKPSTTAISLRLSASMLDQLKRVANKRDVPYQSLMKLWLAEKLADQPK